MERADSAPEHGKDAQSKHRVEFMKNVFELLDGDRDGFITSSDLRSFSGGMHAQTWRARQRMHTCLLTYSLISVVAETWDAGKRMDLAAFMDTVEESCQEVLEFCRSSPLKEAFECVESVSQHRGQDGHVPLAFLKKHLVLNDPQDPITEKQVSRRGRSTSTAVCSGSNMPAHQRQCSSNKSGGDNFLYFTCV